MCLCLVKNMKNDGGCVLAYDLVYATQSFFVFFGGGGYAADFQQHCHSAKNIFSNISLNNLDFNLDFFLW